MKYHIVTLGCPKNIVDSEGMGGILAAQGHMSVTQPGDADVVIVNTCSFIAAARDETLGVLRAMADGKTPGQQLVAAGCMAESHGSLVGAVPGVDTILSTREWMKIGDLVTAGHTGQGIGDSSAVARMEVIPLTVAATSRHPTPIPHLPTPIRHHPFRFSLPVCLA